jgi:glycosyltransferase involved in cell wall biosynthesis
MEPLSTSRRPPTILFLTYRLDVGGIERQIVELLKGLKISGRFRSVLGVLDHGGDLDLEARTFADIFLPIQRKTRFDLTVIPALLKEVQNNGVKMIQTFDWLSSLVGLVIARWLGIPIVHSGIQSALPKLPFREYISYFSARLSSSIVANSNAGLKAYRLNHHPLAQVIYNGIDLHRFENLQPKVSVMTSICMVANFSCYKDHVTVIRALNIACKTYPKLELVLVGRDLGTLPACRNLVAELGLISQIRFETQIIHPEPIIAGSDICVLASTQGEGTSNAILEYMALKKPVVATQCDGNAELIETGRSGLLVEAFSPQAMADGIITLLESPDRACMMGEIGRHKIERVYALDKMISSHICLFDRILSKQRIF